MIKIIIGGNVSTLRSKERFVAKPIRVPVFGELAILMKRYRAYLEYVNTMIIRGVPKISRAVHSSAAEAIRIKRQLDKLYKRWRGGYGEA